MPRPTRRVLIWIVIDTHFREMIRLARFLKSHTSFEPYLVFATEYQKLDEDLATCSNEGIACEEYLPPLRPGRPLPPAVPADGKRSKLRASLDAAWSFCKEFKRLSRYYLVRLVRGLLKCVPAGKNYCYHRDYVRFLARARAAMQRLQPALLVLPEDNVAYGTSLIIKAGHEANVPSVVFPYTIANAREPAEAYWSDRTHQAASWANRSCAARYPHWVMQYKGRNLLRLPAPHVWAQERLGLAPPLPWILNSGSADAVAVESEALRKYYLEAGLPAEQLVVTGSYRQDELATRLRSAGSERQRLLGSLRRPGNGPLVLCAFPPNQYPETRPGCEFSSYSDLARFWASSLGNLTGSTVLVNLHPRASSKDMKYLETFGVHLIQDDIARLIPLCDVFVACVSATICMAIACGKPVVNYDVYRYRYIDYAHLPGVLTIEEKHSFTTLLQRLTTDAAFYAEVAARQARVAGDWGVLDGGAGQRTLELFDRLLNRNRSKAA
jgi:hypothetical protein